MNIMFLTTLFLYNVNTFTKNFEEAVKPSEVVFIGVGTPSLENGEADLSAVERTSRDIARVSDSYKLIVEKSTVPVQTGVWLEKTLRINSSKDTELDDPKAMERTKMELPEVIYCSDAYETLKNADATVICTEWNEFKELNFEKGV